MNGFGDAIGLIVFVVVAIVIWALKALGNMAQKGQPQRPPGRGPQRPGPGGPQEDEIGEFLRRAAQRRQQQQPPAAPPAGGQRPAPRAARPTTDAGPRARRAPQYPAQRAPERPVMAREPPPALVVKPEPVIDAQRVQLASMFAAAQQGPAPGGGSAAGLYAMLSEPASLRQAILLAEILSRPEDRW